MNFIIKDFVENPYQYLGIIVKLFTTKIKLNLK